MLKRIRDLFGRRGKRPSLRTASLPETGDGVATPDDPDVRSGPRELPPVHHGPSAVHRPISPSDLDPDAVKILRRLTRFDHTAYLVGGCVRDLLLDHRPKDFDIGTSATPRQVKRLFSNCRIIGRRFRLAHIYFQNGKIIEVATFRARDDVESVEGQPEEDLLIRDDNVFGTPEEDALRRDFTINALFYDVNSETVIDHADGLGDLRRRLVRTIGDPGIRFREDPIRILRAIRFAARLGFQIEPATLDALRRLRNEISKAAPSRVLEEINRFCRAGASRASFELSRQTGVFEAILPELTPGYESDEPALALLLNLLAELDRRLRDEREPSTDEILAALILPLLTHRMGWGPDGKVHSRGGVNVRELADQLLRPMALRLRVARKDQEGCRQIVMTLHRMVPIHRLRRPLRESLLRRPSFAEAMGILEVISHQYQGEFAESLRQWQEITRTATTGRPAPAPAREREREVEPRAAEGAGERPREAGRDEEGRGRRRRRSRGRSDVAVEVRPSPPQHQRSTPQPPPKERERGPEFPPPWDDRYFFAALPSASGIETAEDRSDRRAAAVSEAELPDGHGEVAPPPVATTGNPPRPRRRTRRRRPRKSGGAAPATDGEAPEPI